MRAILTGCSSGMGLACLKQLIAEGSQVAGIDVRAAAVDSSHTQARYRHLEADLGSLKDIERAVEAAKQWLGGVDALFHFAATWSPLPWDELTEVEWDRVCNVNLKGTFFLVRAVAKDMAARRSGSIVLIASDSVNFGGVAGGPAYVAAKAGVIGLTRAFARVLGPLGIRVNAINPGVIDTPMIASWPANLKEDVLGRTPLGRLGTSTDVASVALFLASHGTSFMTGEVLEVNGGLYFG